MGNSNSEICSCLFEEAAAQHFSRIIRGPYRSLFFTQLPSSTDLHLRPLRCAHTTPSLGSWTAGVLRRHGLKPTTPNRGLHRPLTTGTTTTELQLWNIIIQYWCHGIRLGARFSENLSSVFQVQISHIALLKIMFFTTGPPCKFCACQMKEERISWKLPVWVNYRHSLIPYVWQIK